jgi:hypothetical protein
MDKAVAQRQFIETAQDLGIPPVSWENKSPTYRPPKYLEWNQGPRGLITAGTSNNRYSVSRKLLTRASDSLSLGTGSESSSLEASAEPIGLWLGLSFVSGVVVSLWATLGSLANAEQRRGGSKRLHARAWKEIEC